MKSILLRSRLHLIDYIAQNADGPNENRVGSSDFDRQQTY